jgi:nucleotide-binding universal stress UspA family protein
MGRRAAVHYLNGVAAPLQRAGLTVDVRVVEQLSPAPAIVNFATTHAVDLVVLTTTGGGSIRRLLLGSVADHVIRKGETPVLVCNTRHTESAAADASSAAATGMNLER